MVMLFTIFKRTQSINAEKLTTRGNCHLTLRKTIQQS